VGVGLISGRGRETLDARSLPAGWATPDGDPGWPAAVERRATAVGEPGRPEPPSYPIGPLRPRRFAFPVPTDVALTPFADGAYRAPEVVVGTLLVDVDGPAGLEVVLEVAEMLDADGHPAPSQHDAAFAVALDGSRRTVESLDLYGLRGVRVTVPDGAAVHGITVRERVYPVAGEASFECSDERLETIYRVGRRTVSICSLDAYVDCPTREQRAWVGDSVVHQMVDLTTNTDWDLARRYPHLAASPRPDGMLPMAVAGDAEEADFTVIPDWALHWVHGVWNLHRYVGDQEEIAALLPVVEGVVRWFEPFCGADGLPTDVHGWVIIDWAAVHTLGVSSSLAGLWGRALLELAELSEWLGDGGRASWARRTHARLAEGYEQLWDPERQRYVDSMVAGTRRPMASQHGQAAALVGGLVPASRTARLVEVLTDSSRLVDAAFSNPTGPVAPNSDQEVGGAGLRAPHPEPWWDVDGLVVKAQPFYRYVVHDALAAAGRADLVAEACLDWTVALERCPTSWTETWYGGTVSHGWSSTPTRDLVQRVLGVTPATPGFGVAAVEPALGPSLTWARGAVPTPAGLLRIDVQDGGARIEVDSPIPFVHHGARHEAGVHRLAP
jgi:alpha-L-rhamnosidase